jgi:hypothetical protein
MSELRITDTNSGDDAEGSAFGLTGNLYLPLALAGVAGPMVGLVLHFVVRVPVWLSGVVATVPVFLAACWVFGLRQGKPAGYDRDRVEEWLGGGSFTLVAAQQKENPVT